MAGAVPTKLVHLNMEINNALIIAIVLSKSEPKYFLSKDNNEYRGVITYTIRDSKRHIVNCKFWGSKEKVAEHDCKIKIGDIIDVICPRVLAQLQNDTASNGVTLEKRYVPLATLPYILILNEGQSFLNKHDFRDLNSHRELHNLLRVPHKPLCSVLNLSDVHYSAVGGGGCVKRLSIAQDQYVDLFVVIANFRPLKELKSTRTGQMLSCLELIVVDQSLISGMLLTIWNLDWIKHAQQYWTALKTCLHLIDVKLSYSDFYKSTILNFNGCTLVYANPFGKETESLAEFAAGIKTKDYDGFAAIGSGSLPQCKLYFGGLENHNSYIELKTDHIVNRMTVKQLYTRSESYFENDADEFTAIVYGMITKFDIDGPNLIVNKKCKSCHQFLTNRQTICDSAQCQLAFSLNYSGEKYENVINLNVHISDHSGTLVETRLSGQIAERILNVTAAEFQKLNDKQKEQLKWIFLMSHYEVKLLVKKVNAIRRYISIIIIDMRLVELPEIAQKILTF